MPSEYIAPIAALVGTLIGSSVSILTAYLGTRSTAKEQAKKLRYEAQSAKHRMVAERISKFHAAWREYGAESIAATATGDRVGSKEIMHAMLDSMFHLELAAPELRKAIQEMIQFNPDPGPGAGVEMMLAQERFTKQAADALKALEPELP